MGKPLKNETTLRDLWEAPALQATVADEDEQLIDCICQVCHKKYQALRMAIGRETSCPKCGEMTKVATKVLRKRPPALPNVEPPKPKAVVAKGQLPEQKENELSEKKQPIAAPGRPGSDLQETSRQADGQSQREKEQASVEPVAKQGSQSKTTDPQSAEKPPGDSAPTDTAQKPKLVRQGDQRGETVSPTDKQRVEPTVDKSPLASRTPVTRTLPKEQADHRALPPGVRDFYASADPIDRAILDRMGAAVGDKALGEFVQALAGASESDRQSRLRELRDGIFRC